MLDHILECDCHKRSCQDHDKELYSTFTVLLPSIGEREYIFKGTKQNDVQYMEVYLNKAHPGRVFICVREPYMHSHFCWQISTDHFNPQELLTEICMQISKITIEHALHLKQGMYHHGYSVNN